MDLFEESLHALKNGNLTLFDPNIGDQWCEARTSLFLDIASENHHFKIDAFKTPICDYENRRNNLTKLLGQLEKKRANVCELLKELDIPLATWPKPILTKPFVKPEHIFKYIVLCYFLKKYYSKYREDSKAAAKELKSAYSISSKSIYAIFRIGRKYINEITNDYIGNLDQSINQVTSLWNKIGQINLYQDFSTLLARSNSNKGLKKRAIYPGMMMIMANMWCKNIQIVLNVRVVTSGSSYHSFKLVFIPDKKIPFAFFTIDPQKEESLIQKDKPCLAIEGVSCSSGRLDQYIESIELSKKLDSMIFNKSNSPSEVRKIMQLCCTLGIEKLLAFNTVTHPQYLDSSVSLDTSVLGSREEVFNGRMKCFSDEARRLGCCADYMSGVRIFHIFPDITTEALKRNKSTIWIWSKG